MSNGILLADQIIPVGGSLAYANGRFHLNVQNDGSVVLYSPTWAPLWATNTTGDYSVQDLIIQAYGNLVLRSITNQALWASFSERPHCRSPFMAVQDDGNMVIACTQAVWSTKTNKWRKFCKEVMFLRCPDQEAYRKMGYSSCILVGGNQHCEASVHDAGPVTFRVAVILYEADNSSGENSSMNAHVDAFGQSMPLDAASRFASQTG
ncbi:hypothetical protein PWT90_07201 [Aphanocladium album]|nr:hypothetical protein PWT90_07201 [Aphanocladium album]